MRNFFFVLAILLASRFSQITAQPPRRMGPPPVLLIVREDIKPGKMPAHNIHSASFARIFRQLQTPSHRIALVPVAGSENEVIYITPLDTFKEMEESGRDTDKQEIVLCLWSHEVGVGQAGKGSTRSSCRHAPPVR